MPRLRSMIIYWSTLTKNRSMGPTFRRLVVSSLILVVPLLNSLGKGEIVDRIVAIVNDEVITLSEMEGYRKSFFRLSIKEDDWLSTEFDLLDVRHQALNVLIDERLIDQEVNRKKITVKHKELKETLESLRQEKGWSQSQLEMALKAQGLTHEAYTTEVEKGLKRTKLINRVVKSKIEIKEEDLRTYYETHSKDYIADESIRITHVLLPLPSNPTKDQEEAALSRAKDILERVEQGEDFATLAHQYSRNTPGVQGGDIGYFKKGEMIPAIEKKAFSLEVGEVGGPIRTPGGVVLVTVTDKKGGGPIPLAKIKKRVEKDYYTSELKRRYREWVNKLKEKSFIEVKL